MDDGSLDVGIDVGAHRLAFGWPYWQAAGSIDFGRKPPPRDEELRQLQIWLVRHLPVGIRLWVDQPFAGNGGIAAAQRLSETIGAILTAQAWEHQPTIVHQSSWKAKVIGNHQADKGEIQLWLEEHHPQLAKWCNTEDEYDAMVIGLYGQGRSSGMYQAPDVHRPKRRRKKS